MLLSYLSTFVSFFAETAENEETAEKIETAFQAVDDDDTEKFGMCEYNSKNYTLLFICNRYYS